MTTNPEALPDRPQCPNCGAIVDDHPENGCVLAALMTVLRDRGTHEPDEIKRIHARCDVDNLWQDLDRVVDRLGDGAFDAEQPASSERDGGR